MLLFPRTLLHPLMLTVIKLRRIMQGQKLLRLNERPSISSNAIFAANHFCCLDAPSACEAITKPWRHFGRETASGACGQSVSQLERNDLGGSPWKGQQAVRQAHHDRCAPAWEGFDSLSGRYMESQPQCAASAALLGHNRHCKTDGKADPPPLYRIHGWENSHQVRLADHCQRR